MEGYAFANFGYSSETDGESQNPHITASGDTSLREEKIGLVWKFKGVTKFTQYCQLRHKFERIDRPRKDALEVSQNSDSTVLQRRHRLLCSSWAINSGKGGL